MRRTFKHSRILTVLLALLLMAAPLPVSAAQAHDFRLQTSVPPTCTDSGMNLYVCADCGLTKTETVPARGHDFSYDWTLDKAATCTEAGQQSRHCTRCDAVTDVLRLRPLGHDASSTVVAPTCDAPGYTHHVCATCGLAWDDQYVAASGHTPGLWVVDREADCETPGLRHRDCAVCGAMIEQKSIPALEHADDVTVVAPTCTERGYTLRTCRRCGRKTQSKFVAAAGHSFPENGVRVLEPTCTDKGSETVKCTVCGAVETRAVPALGHDYGDNWVIDKAPTCKAKGEKSLHCRRCGARKSVTSLDRTPHTEVVDVTKAPTCTEAGASGGSHCAVCGAVLSAVQTLPPTGHSFVVTSVLSAATCTAKGSEAVRCSVCGVTETRTVPALGHNYGDNWVVDKAPTCTAKGEKSLHCRRCGARKNVTAIDRAPHTEVVNVIKAPTCTEAGVSGGSHCAVCGAVLSTSQSIPPTGHSFVVTEVLVPATCTSKGSETVTCSVCGVTQTRTAAALGHALSDWTVDKAPTCTAKGEQSQHCERCGRRFHVTDLPRTDHVAVKDRAVKPTCTEAGLTAGKHCKFCGKVLKAQEKVPATGHTLKTKFTPATMNSRGARKTYCTVCRAVTEKTVIPAIKTAALSKTAYAFDGKAKTPTVTVTDANGGKLKKGDDFTLSYVKGRKAIGVYAVTVTFRGDYSGKTVLKFKIVPKAPTGLSYVAKQTCITLRWDDVPKATGYRVLEYHPSTKQYTSLGTTQNLYFKVKNLSPGQVHRFVVRAFTRVGDRVFWSADSAQKLTATKPKTPTVTVGKREQTGVLFWNDCGDCIYAVYAANRANGSFVCLGTTDGRIFVTPAYAAGRTVCFKVKAIVRRGSTDLSAASSDVVSFTF